MKSAFLYTEKLVAFLDTFAPDFQTMTWTFGIIIDIFIFLK